MKYTFHVTVEVNHTQGKFATREEIADQLMEALSSADPGTLTGDNGGEYETQTWEVTDAG
jgi:hypothetical protein